jgi:hypothetical protein
VLVRFAVVCFESHVNRYRLLLSCNKFNFLAVAGLKADLLRFLFPFVRAEFFDCHFHLPFFFCDFAVERSPTKRTPANTADCLSGNGQESFG